MANSQAPDDIKLSYFDFHGGRGEAIRLALSIGGLPFEDDRFPVSDWPARKATTPLGAVPVLTVDGTPVTQSNSLLRYVGVLAGLYPSDPWQALLCDEVMDAIEDATDAMVLTFGLEGEALRAARGELVSGAFRSVLRWLDARLDERGDWFADGRLTVADLKLVVFTKHLNSGQLDHIPTDLVESLAPALNLHAERVLSSEGVLAYYERVGAS